MSDKMDKRHEGLLRGEWIGMKAAVGGTRIKGTIIDESKYMLWIKTEKGVRKVSKRDHCFVFDALPDVTVEGSTVCARPEERIKMKIKV